MGFDHHRVDHSWVRVAYLVEAFAVRDEASEVVRP